MSVKALSWAFEQQTGDPAAKMVLVALADFANPLGESWPGRKKLVQYCESSIDTIDRKLKYLVERGFIVKESRASKAGDHTSNLYTLLFDRPLGAATVAAVCGHPQPLCAATPPAVCGHHDEPSVNHHIEPSSEVPAKAGAGEDVSTVITGKDHAELIAWWSADYLRRIKLPYKVNGGRDGKAVKQLLLHFKTLDATQRFITACLHRVAEFPFNGMTGTLHRFAENISTFQAALATPRKVNGHAPRSLQPTHDDDGPL